MDTSVVIVLIGAALAVVVASSRTPAAEREAVPVRVDDDPQPPIGRR